MASGPLGTATFIIQIGVVYAASIPSHLYYSGVTGDVVDLPNGCKWKSTPPSILNCSNVGLTAVPTGSYLQLMEDADQIWLDHNRIVQITDESFYNVTKTRILFLDSNRINAISNGAFSDMKALEILILKDNSLTVFPHNMRYLPNLRMLDMSDNKVKLLPRREELPGYSNKLRWLNLQGNAIRTIQCGFFPLVGGLNYLEMKNNPSQCWIHPTNGDISCECERSTHTAPGYCQNALPCEGYTLDKPKNHLEPGSLSLGPSYQKMGGLLTQYRRDLDTYLQRIKGAEQAGTDSSSDSNSLEGNDDLITLLLSVSAFAMVALVVANVKKFRKKQLSPRMMSSHASSSDLSMTTIVMSPSSSDLPAYAGGNRPLPPVLEAVEDDDDQ